MIMINARKLSTTELAALWGHLDELMRSIITATGEPHSDYKMLFRELKPTVDWLSKEYDKRLGILGPNSTKE